MADGREVGLEQNSFDGAFEPIIDRGPVVGQECRWER